MDEADRPRRILSVLHAAERTGPPLFALRYLRWLKAQRPAWETDTLFLDAGGPLVDEFGALGRARVRDQVERRGVSWRLVRLRDRALRDELRRSGPYDLIHVHCAGSMRVVPVLPSEVPILCHVHELSVGLDFHLDLAARRHLDAAEHYVTVSDAVRHQLLASFRIDPDRVERQWGFVDASELPAVVDRSTIDALRGIPPEATLVVASGVRHWRKAPERFLRVAHRVRTLDPERTWRFVWVGGDHDESLQRVVDRSELGSIVRFVDHVTDPLSLIGAADVFFLPAREDAFPLVCVEAAALGRPILAFDSGGTSELISAAGCGRTVEFPDVDLAAAVLQDLAGAPDERRSLGEAAASFVQEHLTLDVAGPRLLTTMVATMDSR